MAHRSRGREDLDLSSQMRDVLVATASVRPDGGRWGGYELTNMGRATMSVDEGSGV